MKLVLLISLLLSASCLPVKNKSIVNDVTKLNPIAVDKVLEPTTSKEVLEALKNTSGIVSIGGGRFSMGGQTATEKSIHFDMRYFNKLLHLDVDKMKVTVQSGMRWRELQEKIDKHNLSIKVMQSYSNFTVGGSLSVNCHGRYVGEGPIMSSVEAFRIILADGREVKASRKENRDIFYSAIGGYGGIGVITEVTLNLVKNEKIRREIILKDTSKYKYYFWNNIRKNKKAVLHNGNIYPPDFKTISLETWYRTETPLTDKTRLIPKGKRYWLEPNVISSISTIPYGATVRQNIIDPVLRKSEKVVWRNFEASQDVAMLEPSTPRLLFTYVLQEYFIPVQRFEDFVAKMKSVFEINKVNVINVSIRHAFPDEGSYLAWAPEEVFSFVVYYKQRTGEAARIEVGNWTRQMIDQALSVGGSYYLPYQIHANKDQFKKAYKRSGEFFKIKKKYDPTNRFRNKLWDKYYL